MIAWGCSDYLNQLLQMVILNYVLFYVVELSFRGLLGLVDLTAQFFSKGMPLFEHIRYLLFLDYDI